MVLVISHAKIFKGAEMAELAAFPHPKLQKTEWFWGLDLAGQNKTFEDVSFSLIFIVMGISHYINILLCFTNQTITIDQ